MDAQPLLSNVLALNSEAKVRDKADRPAVTIPAPALPVFLRKLHDEPSLAFDALLAHTAIDWQAAGQFELVYQLFSTTHGHYLMVTTSVPREKPEVPTASRVYRIAEWQEREVYDMFGVLYGDHPDLRRLILDDSWVGHPLRKDYKDDFMLERPQ